MSSRKRNSKGQFAPEYPEEEYHQTYAPKSRDPVSFNFNIVFNYVWTIAKVALIIVILGPFIDKLRQKEFLSKGLEFINQIDIGCPRCECPKLGPQANGGKNTTDKTMPNFGDIFYYK